MVEQAGEINRELRNRIRRRKAATPSVTAKVWHDHAMSSRKTIEHRLEHFAGDHHAMYKQERRS